MSTKKGTPNFEEAKIITWFEVGLRHEAIRLSKKHHRLLKHELLILNQPIKFNGEDDSIEMIDTLQDGYERFYKLAGIHDPFFEVERNIYLKDILSVLTFQQNRVITAIIMEGRTETETAKRLGMSQPAVHRMKNRALLRLRKKYILDGYTN